MTSLKRHTIFLKDVFVFALTAFGGPQGHLSIMLRTFVNRKRYVTEDELIAYNAFCQMLPGPSSSQTIMLIGYKRGGLILALLTLLIWLLPAASIMISLALAMNVIAENDLINKVLIILQAVSIGFILYAGVLLSEKKLKDPIHFVIVFVSVFLTLMIKSPWVFPAIIIVSGLITNISKKKFAKTNSTKKPIQWISLWLFGIIFLVLGVVSETARKQDWQYKKQVNLSENFYRFGSTIFGGGQALVPMMVYQFEELPKKRKETPIVETNDIMNGFALVQSVPGPVFSISGYVGARAVKNESIYAQIITGLISVISIFLPSTLLVLFLFPIFQRVNHYMWVLRALEGINAAIIGIIFASAIIMFDAIKSDFGIYYQLFTIILTFLLLRFTKIAAPIIILFGIVVGLIFGLLG